MLTQSPKVLGQKAPAATTETTLYTAPSAAKTVVSSLVVCNRGAAAATFRISVSVDGAATATKDYLAYDVALPGNEVYIATVGITLDGDDTIRVYASNNQLSFSAFGVETT